MGGRGFQPGNKLGRGRPRGSRNKVTTLTQELLNDHAPSITRKCIALALQGDASAMRLCMERIAPVRRDFPVTVGTLPIATPEDLNAASETVLKRVAEGKMTIAEAQGFFSLLEARRALLQNSENNSPESIPAFNVRKADSPVESPNPDAGKEKREDEKVGQESRKDNEQETDNSDA